jgi:predicted DNA-binding protein with PD1-like motif
MASLQNFVAGQNISAAQFSAIGAISDLVLMYFDWEENNYLRLRVNEQVEVASPFGQTLTAHSSSGRKT